MYYLNERLVDKEDIPKNAKLTRKERVKEYSPLKQCPRIRTHIFYTNKQK